MLPRKKINLNDTNDNLSDDEGNRTQSDEGLLADKMVSYLHLDTYIFGFVSCVSVSLDIAAEDALLLQL